MTHEGHHGVNVLAGESHSRRDPLRQFDTDSSVVAVSALANVMQKSRHNKQVRSVGAVSQPGCFGNRLQEMPVDGEAVVRVVLGTRSDIRPLGEDR